MIARLPEQWPDPGPDGGRQFAIVHRALRAASDRPLDEQLEAIVGAMRELGFARVVVVTDATAGSTMTCSGLSDDRAAREAAERWRGSPPGSAQVGRVGGATVVAEPTSADEVVAGGAPLVVVPLGAGQASCGVILAGGLTDPYPVGRSLDLLAGAAEQAVRHAAQRANVERGGQRVRELREMAARLSGPLDEAAIGRELAHQLTRLMPCSTAVVAVWLAEREVLQPMARVVDGVERPPVADAALSAVLETAARTRLPTRSEPAAHGPGAPGSVLAAPMLAGSTLVGVAAVQATTADALGADDEEALLAFGALAAAAIDIARRYASSQLQRRQSDALAQVARAVSESLRLSDVMQLILSHATALLHAEGAFVLLRNGDVLDIMAADGRGERVVGMKMPMSTSLAGQVVRQGHYEIANDATTDPRLDQEGVRAGGVRRIIFVPLVTAQGAVGSLAVMNRDTPFGDADARVLQALADQVAVAIVNARLFEQLESSTRQWATAFDAIATGMVVLDAVGRVVRCNARALELCGRRTAAALIGERFEPLLLGDGDRARPGVESPVERAVRTGAVERASLRSAVCDRVFEIVAAPHPGGGAVVTFDDVTELHAVSARYRSVVDSAIDAIVITDRERRIAFANPAASVLLGRPWLAGLSVSELLPPEARAEVALRESSALAGGSERYETTVLRPDGSQRVVAVSTAPLRELGQVTGIVASLRDVSAEKARAVALGRSEARYARLLEAAWDAIFTVDERGHLTSMNAAMVMGSSLSAEQAMGRHFCDLVHPDDRERIQELFARTLGGEATRGEVRYLGRGGITRVTSLVASPIVEDGQVVGCLGIARDITREKRLAAQLLQHEKLAAVGQLVSGVAHELNNPLAGIMAFAQLLLASPNTDREAREAAEVIEREAKRAARIVSNLLTFARQREPTRALTSVNAVLEAAVELHQYALRAQQVELRRDLDPMLPRTWADDGQLQQVFANLLTNAEQALANWPGERRVTVTSRQRGARIVVQVADTGPGIEPARAERIFNPFFTTKPVGEGTGLGLSISHGILREHNGSIRVDSRAGGGAVFTVELPIVSAPQLAPSVAPVGDTRPRPRDNPPRVLVVDDEPAILTVMARHLARLGYEVETAGGGHDAARRLAATPFDAVLLDLRMPDLSGAAVYAAVRARDPEQAARIIFLTGDVSSEQAWRFIAGTGCASIRKPFVLEEVTRVLDAQLAARP